MAKQKFVVTVGVTLDTPKDAKPVTKKAVLDAVRASLAEVELVSGSPVSKVTVRQADLD